MSSPEQSNSAIQDNKVSTAIKSSRNAWRHHEILDHADLDLFNKAGYHAEVKVDNVVILAHTHCLPSTYYLFRQLVSGVGIPAENITILPKPYSTIDMAVSRIEAFGIKVLAPKPVLGQDYDDSMQPYVEQICSRGFGKVLQLSRRQKKTRVVLIDDGGILTRQWLKHPERRRASFDTVSVQQTRSGIAVLGELVPLPVINVAQSAAKRKFESHIIADAIIEKCRSLKLVDRDRSIGVFGLGMIGRAIAKGLLDRGVQIRICDERARQHDGDIDYWDDLKEASSRRNFVDACDVILGTTSANWLQDYLIPRRMVHEKTLVSCSSRDREFQYILKQPGAERATKNERFADVLWRPPGRAARFRLLNGGFPINFDRHKEWEPPEHIALTRVLILAAVLQAICTDTAAMSARYVQLDPGVQRHLTHLWMEFCGKTPKDFDLSGARLDDLDWWIAKSAGGQPIDPRDVDLAA